MDSVTEALLLHGFTHTGASWGPVRAALGRGYRATAPDLRGHGAAGALEPVCLEAVLDDLSALAPRAPFVLGGYSQGGRIALHAALDPRLSGRVARLVLVGASPGLADPGERAARRAADERLADRIVALGVERFSVEWGRTPVLSGLPAMIAGQVHADRLRSSAGGLARALRGLGTGALPSLWERLGEIEAETVLVVGEHDEKFRAIAEQMAPVLKRARIEVVAGAGHAVHLAAPQAVAAAIRGDSLRAGAWPPPLSGA